MGNMFLVVINNSIMHAFYENDIQNYPITNQNG